VSENAVQQKETDTSINNATTKNIFTENEIEDIEFEEEILIDEEGRKYKILNLVRELPRRTYILGDLNGKYWGEIDTKKETEFVQHKFFDFNIYEVSVKNVLTSVSPFKNQIESEFPREKLPTLLSVILQKDGKEYELNLHEPKFILNEKKEGVVFNRKLHQDEGTEVFGTIDAKVTGYVLDFIKEEYQEVQYLNQSNEPLIKVVVKNDLQKTISPTGNVEYKDNYTRTEYFYNDFKTTYWDNWKYNKPTKTNHSEGCLSSLLGIIGLVIGVVFFILLLPQLGILLPILAIPFLLNIIPSNIWNWIFRIFAGLLLFAFIASIFYSISNTNSNYVPKKYAVDDANEKKSTLKPISEKDTIISHFRSWRDYDNNLYEGSYFVKYRAYQNAKSFKNNLQISGNNQAEYDKILFSLKENDKENFNNLYQLFDTLRFEKKLDSIAFAKMIVSFVQDIPYALVLPENCDPNLYSDNFIKQYLNSNNAKCDGFEKFGINTPVEFLATLNGDCDTRTLLLYTILAHYNYDVALLSSELYSHSIIGINLPIEGKSYNYNNQQYILWETTSPNIKPGILPSEISNTNNWRISLKSK
jgi:energy-coupling factor transporter transmembrane protein EcfT